jgi:hypothetical protein
MQDKGRADSEMLIAEDLALLIRSKLKHYSNRSHFNETCIDSDLRNLPS